MIQFDRFSLDNGLRVLVQQDKSTPMAVVNVLYDVGARDEDPAKTGFAHLFEHLMFGGSVNIPVYDEPLQLAGGETTPSPPTTSPTIASCPPRTWKQLSGSRATACCRSPSVRKSLKCSARWFVKSSRSIISISPMAMYGIRCGAGLYHAPYRWMTIGKN